MNKKGLWSLTMTILLLSTSLMFNNCAPQFEMKDSNQASSGTVIPVGSNDLAGQIPSFQFGEPLTRQKVELLNPTLGSIIESYLTADPSLSKAIAITYDNLGVFGFYDYNQGESSAIEYAISMCNARYQKKCVLLSKNNTFNLDSNQLIEIRNQNGSSGSESQAQVNQEFSAETMSFLRGHNFVSNYLGVASNKAIALSWKGTLHALWSEQSTQEEISRAVVESCQIQSQSRCILLAEGNKYVWDYKSHSMKWTLPLKGSKLTLPVTSIPSIVSFNQQVFEEQYLAPLSRGGRAILIMVPGRELLARSVEMNSAETREQMIEILTQACRDRYPDTRDQCLLFTHDLDVVWDITQQN